MKNFRVSFGTKLIVGPGEFARLGEESARLGRKALLVSYQAGAGPGDIFRAAEELLEAAGVDFVPFERVEPNPRDTTCDEGAAALRDSGCDQIVALGGGSVIDSAKGISAVAANGGRCWDYVRRRGGGKDIRRAVPILAVPTTAATGSEANPEAVISNRETREKCVIVGPPNLAPRAAILDPELHLTVPRGTTADGVVDIVSHVLDPYLSGHGDCGVQDGIAESIVNAALEWGPVAYADGANLRARRELLYASTLAISDLALAGRAGTWLMHNIEHALSAHYDIPHGLGMAIVMPRVLRYLEGEIAPRLARLGERCFGVSGSSVDERAGETIAMFVAWLGRLDRDITLRDVGIDAARFADMADSVIRNDGDGEVYRGVRDLRREDIVRVLERCLEPNG